MGSERGVGGASCVISEVECGSQSGDGKIVLRVVFGDGNVSFVDIMLLAYLIIVSATSFVEVKRSFPELFRPSATKFVGIDSSLHHRLISWSGTSTNPNCSLRPIHKIGWLA